MVNRPFCFGGLALLSACSPVPEGNASWLGSEVVFADASTGADLLQMPDDYTAVMSDYDRGVRLRTREPTTEADFLAFAGSQALDWDPAWRDDWGRQTHELADALDGMGLVLPDPLYVVATDDDFEFGFAHTRGNTIVLPAAVLSSYRPDDRRALLAHELFHVLSRNDRDVRDRLYALLTFDRIEPIAVPIAYEERRLTNPDAFTLEHAADLDSTAGSLLGAPFLHGTYPLQRAMNEDGLYVDIFVVDAITGDAIAAEETTYTQTVAINTTYDLHPEEALADNFAFLIDQRAGRRQNVDQQELLDAIDAVVTE